MDETSRQDDVAVTPNREVPATDYVSRVFVKIVRDAMESQRIGRTELAKRLKVSRTYITNLLNSRRSFTTRTMTQFADALGIELQLTWKGVRREQ